MPAEQQERIGLKTALAERKTVEQVIRTVGAVAADQRTEAHVHTRINGWVERMFADFIGKPVKKGQPLFELYSPDLVATQEELIAARRQGKLGKDISSAARERLKLWDVSDREIEQVLRGGKPKRTITFNSPVDGIVVNKSAIQGMYVTPEMELYHIADLSKVWIIATLYESDVSTIQIGDVAEIRLPYDPTKSFRAPVSYIYPEIDPETRTGKARIELPNPVQALKPGMFANVEIRKNLGESVVVPEDSVIDTGLRKIVFVKTGATKFEPREVKAGPRIESQIAILSGVKAGDPVVVSAHFLIDAESKFQAALSRGDTKAAGHSGHGSPP